MISLKDCKDGYLYLIRARNSSLGIFSEEHNGFIISREKFGFNYLFIEYHFSMSKTFGTATPLEELEKVPMEIKSGLEYRTQKELLEYLNSKETEYQDRIGKYRTAWYEEVKKRSKGN